MDYSESSDFSTMQEEAIKRVREMQQRSKSIVGGEKNAAPPPPPSTPHSEPTSPPKQQQKETQNGNTPNLQSILGGLLGGSGGSKELFSISNIKIDEEKALIGMLIYILHKNGADVKLLLALGYLLL